ncbi:MAG: hypothetical protein O3B99_03340, partial [Proteobacteria bacterium]|nr:hypothetical protein [Pseudomonadota bacterium]
PRPAVAGEGPRRVADPWRPDALAAIAPDDDVLILGSGLTMVDVVLALQAQGWRGRATVVSRRGLLPQAHGAHHDAPIDLPPESLTGALSHRLASVRRLARDHGWRRVMEGYRPITAALWGAADDRRTRPLPAPSAPLVGRSSPPHRARDRRRAGDADGGEPPDRRRRPRPGDEGR